ncbi:hypothetical protein RN001_006007 [Aquatica leii]|uniref:Alpha-(1,6)-fucosyltransferase n=1 Tax=Aquatica leii TaxID=1421715 RepID=A0AAN7SQ20_9COLE|nr:hypothetical protein RN001_006007 [Aquatica leii]
MVGNKVPTFEYEMIRRRIMRDIQEVWYFITANMNELKSKPNTNPSAVSIIKKVLLLGFEYKRTLANNIEKLTEVDGFNDWRNNEITDLSNIVQTRLHYLQNPLNCENARKLVCTISYGCGFGCQMHHLISCMILAYGMQRTLLLESTGWQYHRGGWNQVFMPLSKNCTTISKGSIDNWPGTNNSKIIRIFPFTYILPRSQYLPLAVPEDLFVRLKTIHGNPTVWWIGQLLKYIWKPNNLTTNYINGKTKKLDMKSPIVGVHIRRTDKIINEAKYIAIEEYMKKVDEYYSLIEIKSNVTKRRVYIATDDFNVITEAKAKYPHYEIFYNENIPKIPETNPIHSNDNILDVILDIHVLVNSNFLVCTFSSNIGRLAYALKQINYVDASTKCVSLDGVYVYIQQNPNQCKTILNHKAQTTDEIDLVFGDIINITQYTLDGYSLGTNTCGFGCQMHHLISYMILAYGMQRTLILQSTGWQYHRSGWNDIFMPLSNHCTIINNVSVDEWPGTSDSKAINLPITTAIKPRSEYLPLAIPEDIANRLRTIHGNPSVWWIGQILKYIWRPQNLIKTYINEKMRELKIERPFVGIQIRRTDKLIREAKYHSIEEYMFKVDEYYNITEINNNITKRRVYIATDDINVIKEAKTNYSHYEILYNTNIPKVPKMDHFHSNDNLFDVILDIHILAYSNFLVCTFSSNMCRLVYELMQNDYVDASRMATSIDDVYYYHQQKNNKHRVILKHESQAPGEIDLLPGDIIHIYNNQWNGYSLGTNLRTNQKGLYPNFKVEMEPEIIKFPSYPDIENN